MKQINSFCRLPFNRVKIDANADVQMCCHQSKRHIGNLSHSSFEDIWFSQVAKDIRSETLEGRLHKNCQFHVCPFMHVKDLKSKFYPIDVNLNGMPTELEIDLHPTHCNFGGVEMEPSKTCIMCPRSNPSSIEYFKAYPDRTFEIVEKSKHLMPNLKSLSILGVAEPFWKDKIFEIFDQLDFKKYSKNITFWTHTNGSIFDERRMKKYSGYVQKGSLNFSIDAATEETFMKIRKNKVFHTIIKNLRNWMNYSRSLNDSGFKHKTKIYNNINSLNVHEIPAMVRMAHELKVDMLFLIPTHKFDNNDKKMLDILPNTSNYKQFLQYEAEGQKLAKELNVNLGIYRSLDDGMSEKLIQISF
jgi:MoaA/NifB/PqqE/SkfB family radical SAM enzyme